MRLLLAALALWIAAAPAGAAQGMATAQDAVEGVALIAGWRQADGSRLAGIEIRLAPGWHTYWRAPGSAGIPPTFDWSGRGTSPRRPPNGRGRSSSRASG